VFSRCSWHLMGLGCEAARLKPQSVIFMVECYRIDAVFHSLPASAPARELVSVLACLFPLARIKHRAVAQHSMHDDRKALGERGLRMLQRRAMANAQSFRLSGGLNRVSITFTAS
jgi:hypothetical protein